MLRCVSRIVAVIFVLVIGCTLAFAVDVKLPTKVNVPATGKAAAAAKAQVGLVDINSASDGQLKAIPGIGDAYSKKIIAGRPYSRKDQLKTKKIIPDALYEKIKDKIVAKQLKK